MKTATMRLVAVQTIQVPREQETAHGTVPLLGDPVTVTRAWFQCADCQVVAALDGLASPSLPPPCPQGCDHEEGTEQ